VVIGATGVLGGAIAEGLATAGAKVAVLGRSSKRGEVRVRSILDKGGPAEFFAADAIDLSSLKIRTRKLVKPARHSNDSGKCCGRE
jgi:NAD(P)-dependent dehydrogenase (short-subunit alcohol dehydrogenase family)